MNKLWGTHPGFRANHAKGVVVEGQIRHHQVPRHRQPDLDEVFASRMLPT
jgi:hypothetical protein